MQRGEADPIDAFTWIGSAPPSPSPPRPSSPASHPPPGERREKKLAFAFSSPLSPGGRVCGGREGVRGSEGPEAANPLRSERETTSGLRPLPHHPDHLPLLLRGLEHRRADGAGTGV